LSSKHVELQHHFEDLGQQFESSQLGMWAFLAQEILFFGGLFTGYVVYRTMYPAAWAAGSFELDIMLGGVNTAILICSSLTMAMAVYWAQKGEKNKIILFLVLTLILGCAFLGIKTVEYSHKFHAGLIPGNSFSFDGPLSDQVRIFFSFYFAMTGMHALHMIIGTGILIWLIIQAAKGRYTAEYNTPVEMFGLYWHFVDLVWVFVFTFFYLI